MGQFWGAMQNSWENARCDPFLGGVEYTRWPALWRTTFVKNAGYIYGEIGVCLHLSAPWDEAVLIDMGVIQN